MIASIFFKKEKTVLVAESHPDALMVKNGIAGKNNFFFLPPFGNKVGIAIETNNIILGKESGKPLTYDEARNLVKKIKLIGRIAKLEERAVLKSSRDELASKLSFLYPMVRKPIIEFSFAYNWLTIEFEVRNMTEISIKLRAALENKKNNLKITSDDDMIGIHNYDLNGILLRRADFEAIGKILAESKIIAADEIRKFALRTTLFGVKAAILMEARQINRSADENFDFSSDANYNPLTGDRKFLSSLMKALDWLSDKGIFLSLNDEQLKLLAPLCDDLSGLDKYSFSPLIKNIVAAMLEDFKDELKVAYSELKQ